MPAQQRTSAEQDRLYAEATSLYGAALERLARAYEPDLERRRDLLQEIQLAVWRSFAGFGEQCSMRTWVYRVAHNVATSQVVRRRGRVPTWVSLDELAELHGSRDWERQFGEQHALERLFALIEQLRPLDRQVIVLYLEDTDAATIGEITGLSAVNVATKVHRIKRLLIERFRKGS
ncbi:MAG: sigma-70 family RNA polymerase sigma factor [Vicinamibacterales bacterium]